ncbi:MAG: 50S ribosomal protein L10 [Bdellovibrionota bacterium]
MDRSDKEKEIAFLSEQLEKAPITMCVDYRGLTASEISALRQDLATAGSVGKVVKNTLALRTIDKVLEAAEKAEVEKLSALLTGPSMLIFAGEDQAVASAKVVSNFRKDNEKFDLKGGWFDGAFVDDKGIEALSKMPSREELLSKLLSIMQAPATKLVQLLNAPARQLVGTLDAYKNTLSE